MAAVGSDYGVASVVRPADLALRILRQLSRWTGRPGSMEFVVFPGYSLGPLSF